jgi:hypothetical protein
MSEMLTVYQPRRTLRSAGEVTLVTPKVKSVTYGDRQFKYKAAKLWNSLSSNIQEAKTLETFKKLLKTHFFKIEYGH